MTGQSNIAAEEFQRWLEPLLDRAAAYAYAIVRRREDAEDAVQEAALKAFRAVGGYDRSRSFKGWWFSIIRHCCLDLLRKRKTQPAGDDAMVDDLPSGQPLHSENLARRDMLTWAMGRLEPSQREIVQLRYFGDCSYRDIAAALDIPLGTVMSRLHAARKTLSALCKGEMR